MPKTGRPWPVFEHAPRLAPLLSRRTEGPAGCQKSAETRPIFEHGACGSGVRREARPLSFPPGWLDRPGFPGGWTSRGSLAAGQAGGPWRLDRPGVPGGWTGRRTLAAGRVVAPAHERSTTRLPSRFARPRLSALTHSSLARLRLAGRQRTLTSFGPCRRPASQRAPRAEVGLAHRKARTSQRPEPVTSQRTPGAQSHSVQPDALPLTPSIP